LNNFVNFGKEGIIVENCKEYRIRMREKAKEAGMRARAEIRKDFPTWEYLLSRKGHALIFRSIGFLSIPFVIRKPKQCLNRTTGYK